ncbi:hypothetical protein [Marinomonas gallaica]|uniref:hypothetical protein n=1 Tax=Marinomonas gallaica TaxID=1806667 RepID=UPI003A8F56D7
MEKWILWLLLEAATIMTVASLWFIWRSIALRKKLDQERDNESPELDASSSQNLSGSKAQNLEQELPFKAFAQELERQANIAADTLKDLRSSDDLDTVTRFKVWGTLLKAERAILLNDQSNEPKPILIRFMASIISSLEQIKHKKINKNSLTQSLKDIDEEFNQASELLISKEVLLANQKELHQELHKSIERSEQKLKKLGVKHTELQRLQLELKKQHDQVSKLEQHFDYDDQYYTGNSDNIQSDAPQHQSTKHLHKLERLSKRQQAIIENLQAQLNDTSDDQEDKKEQVQKMALERMERISSESNSLIGQLQSELDSANLSITTLKENISEKDRLLQEIDRKLGEIEGSAYTEFQSINSNKRDALESLLDDFVLFKEDNDTNTFEAQELEARKLEQVLKESETCVQLLAQELERAEAENASLRIDVEQRVQEAQSHLGSNNIPNQLAELGALREENRDLISQIQQMKDNLMNEISSSNEKTLRKEYNKKSLEMDRLQLAYSDLEKKYLGTLR